MMKEYDQETVLRQKIEAYYLPQELISAIMNLGQIPENSTQQFMGIGFIDIADYTYISKFLSSKENQEVLNGIYSALGSVIKKHGGYLNKTEGDSLMFHFGGIVSRKYLEMDHDEQVKTITKDLFYACIEMQRVISLFNKASATLLDMADSPKTAEPIENAYHILKKIRSGSELGQSLNAFFQIRARIGANIGEVMAGNFGPDGAKQWDIIGSPVIDAKRMESSAPVGGLRVTKKLFDVLEKTGITNDYFQRFLREARAAGSSYKDISRKEIFLYKNVMLKDKKDARFETFSIQVNSMLPEEIKKQVISLLKFGMNGIDRVLEILKYYRGNKYVIDSVEDAFMERKVNLHKDEFLKLFSQTRYKQFLDTVPESLSPSEHASSLFSLYTAFSWLGDFQDTVKSPIEKKSVSLDPEEDFSMAYSREHATILSNYQSIESSVMQKAYFFNVIYPLVFEIIRCSLTDYLHSRDQMGHLEEESNFTV